MTNKYINVTVSGNDLKKVSVNKTQANHTINASADLSVYYSNRAREWAISDKLVDNEDFSSKYYSQKSKEYAENGEKQIAQVLETSSNAMVEIENNKDLALSNIETKASEAVEIAINEVTAQELKSINNITDTAEAETSKSITSIQEAFEEELQKIPDVGDLVTQTDLNTAIASIPQFKLSIVSKLPATGEKLVLYLIPKTGSNNDVYNEYIWIENTNTFEFIGTTAVDLTNYATKEELEDKADNSTVVHKNETEVITGLKTFTQPLKIQNGAGTGALIIGGDVNLGTLTNGVRKLARVAVPTQNNKDLMATLLGFDSNGDDALHIKNKNYDAISFGGQTKITNATSPMSIGFCVAKTRNGTNANDKIYALEMDSSEARFNVQPNYNGVNLATTNDIPDVSNKAPISSPAFTGTPTSTTPDTSDNSTKIATTAFVKNVVANLSGGENNSSSGGGQPIGTIYQLVCTKDYVPEGSLPCDGTEYTKAQFTDLWDNYLVAGKYYAYYTDGLEVPTIEGKTTITVYTKTLNPTTDDVLYELIDGEMIENTSGYSIEWVGEGYIHVIYPADTEIGVYVAEAYREETKDVINSLLNTCTYDEYATDLATYGQCGKFAVDTTNNKFKVPTIKDGAVIQQALSDSELGKAYNAGLPNITGGFLGDTELTAETGLYWDGAFTYNSINKYRSGGTSGRSVAEGEFDASLANPIYGNSNTVQMNAVALRYFVVVANGSINQSQMDWSEWASNLQSKINADHSNDPYPYVKEIYQNDTSWYVLYSNGWCEQGGIHIPTSSASSVTINLLKPYINTNYSILRTNITSNSSNTSYRAEGVSNTTTNSFDMYVPNISTVSKVVWEAKGYIA